MTRKILLLSLLIFSTVAVSMAQVGMGTLIGTVSDESGEPIPFANVVVMQAGQQVTGASTDFDGKYKIPALKPANDYVVKASVVGFTAQEKRGVIVKANQNNFVDFKMSAGVKLDEVVVIDYEVPLIEKDGGAKTTVTGKDIEKMPSRGAATAVTTVAGVQDNDGQIGSVRGTRDGSTYTYIDGVKVRGSANLPQAAYEQVQVLTGGVPARYGDATGGIISITTKGASQQTHGGIELVSSGGIRYNDNNDYLFDAQGYHLIAANITGPLLSIKDKTDPEGKKKKPIIGYFLAGEVNYQADPRPSAIGNYYVKDDVLADLQENPIVQSSTGASVLRSQLVRKSDLEWTAQRKNTRYRGVVASGNLDFYLSPSITLKVGGSLDFNDRKLYSYNGSMFNYENNGLQMDKTWRVYGRFTQRFNNQTADAEGGKKKKSAISNAYYSIQADYERYTTRQMNEEHQDRLFRYGYLGKFTTYREPTYQLGIDDSTGLFGYLQGPYNDTLVTFEASDINPNLAAYTAQYYNLNPDAAGKYENLTQIEQDRGALRNGDLPRRVYDLWDNTGTQFNGYNINDNSQFRIMATGSFDIKNHSISLGFEYEQRKDAFIGYAPRGLWTITRLYMNNHFRDALDPTPIIHYDANGNYTDSISYNPLYTPDPDYPSIGKGQYFIDYNVRKALGLDPSNTDFIDIDALDPDFFDISWFSADELLNNGNNYVSYYGYDHTGKRLSSKPTFDDFFNERDEFGNYTRRIGAFEPVYLAGYIQDEFTFKDLIFRVGVRVDRYDANQKVLKDPYLFREAYTKDEVDLNTPRWGGGNASINHPNNIPGDAVVYVNDIQNPSAILGYRVGSTWYDQSGTEVTDPSTLQAGTGIAPYLINPPVQDPNSNDPVPVTTADAFQDYKPQVNVMPRISFSFPISENALFFANYDVLTQRPLGGNRLNLIDYLYIQNSSNNVVNNPDLKPEKTIEYAIGFKQKLSKRSAIELNAFYREMRDQITTIRVTEAYPKTYLTYGNLDFGTVKGLTLTYDLRRTKNIQLRLSYTLQFADGTGSNATTSLNLVNAGFPNLRVIQPLSFDQRHNIVLSADYRFGEGNDYNGPKTVTKGGKTINWLQNFGVNAIVRAGSGNPFSRQSNIQPTGINDDLGSGFLEGSINGSSKPWQFRVDMRVDKDFLIKWNKGKEGKPAKTSYLNVYLDIQNLLGTKNVINTYRATGNPDDDGYLLAASSQSAIQSQTDEQSFRDLYAIKVNRPTNYSLPRRIRLGLMLNF
ncbi:MAG: carboxypeptidase regulatory-like domain-containing protein [Flavobacteriales bacterium]|nr:carboxypeptidase regulatory-like domain-containing protein [Flavobacteriales bacterium]